MTLQMTVSPDFAPDHLGGWYVFATWLSRQTGQSIHLELFDSFEAQRAAIARREIDLIYANPYDAALLVREYGFTGLAAPIGREDEVVLATARDDLARVEQLQTGTRVAVTADPQVNLIGKILMEPADLPRDAITWVETSSYTAVARHLIQGKADLGFFLKEAYDTLSNLTRRQLSVLVTSQMDVIRHMLLAGPGVAEQISGLGELVAGMQQSAPNVLASLEFSGFTLVDTEQTEFMIDVIDTLAD